MIQKIYLKPIDPTYQIKADQILQTLPFKHDPQARFILEIGDSIQLQDQHHPNFKPLIVDFLHGTVNHRLKYGGGKQQDLSKAVGLHRKNDLTILDSTAGLGQDAMVLASLGANVIALERHPLLYLLLQDGLTRAATQLPEMTKRIQLFHQDALGFLQQTNKLANVDVIYLDPMFPPRQKSAQVKANMQLLHDIAGQDVDKNALLSAALNTSIKRIVLKQPRHAPLLTAHQPTHQVIAKSCRWDIFIKKA